MEVNLTGVFYCCKAVIPQMHTGKIVNMISVAGKNGGTIGPHYAASKAGIIGLTFSLATELAPEITVNAVAPGPVETEFLTREEIERMSSLTPFKRIATPEEVAHAVMFFIENDYVSGEVVDVNAGRYMD
jgi:3-oxoacyl-[acyl-carrier protein] reductase